MDIERNSAMALHDLRVLLDSHYSGKGWLNLSDALIRAKARSLLAALESCELEHDDSLIIAQIGVIGLRRAAR